jgi:adenylate cyclase
MRFLRDLGKWLSQHAHGTIALASAAIGVALFAYSGIGENQRAGFVFLQDIEQRSLDLRFSLRGNRQPDPRIVIVGIDEKTLREVGSFPLPRSSYVLLVRKLKEDGARVIAFDMTFPTPASSESLAMLGRLRKEIGTKGGAQLQKEIEALQQQSDFDAQFADALKSAGNVVLGHLFLAADRAAFFDPKLTEAYFNIIWAKAFPQVLKAQSGRQDFDLGKAWIQAGGMVAQGVEPNLPQFAEAAASYGSFSVATDADGTLRRALFMIGYQDLYFPSLDLEALQQYENIPDQQIAAYISADGLERIQFGSHEIRPWQNGTALINYVGPFHSYPHYSMADVLYKPLPADTFRDKIVLVGPTALGIGDLANTPFQKRGSGYMGVEVHANIIDNLLHSNEPHRTFLVRGFREELVDLGFILLFGAGLGLWFGRCRPLVATATVVVVLGMFAGFVYFSFAHWGRWFSFVIPAATLVGSYVFATSFRVMFEEREKRRIRKSFSQYLSPGVIALIEKDPQKYIKPGGEMKDLTVMFSDIRDFTHLSEGLTPDELVGLLNEYLGAMTDILFRHFGTLDKYIGDAIMAFWGSPYPLKDHAYQACCCATEMVARLAELNRDWAAHGRPAIAIGIGVNTGPVNVGNMGSDKRLAWTVMGDNVNLASRLEGMTKEYRTQIIISESTYGHVKDQFVAREVDKIRVKGKHHPVTIYELMGPISDLHQHQALLAQYNAALECYRTHDWREAAGKFGELLFNYPHDGPTQVLLQRCVEFFEEAPEQDWDGVYVMKSK